MHDKVTNPESQLKPAMCLAVALLLLGCSPAETDAAVAVDGAQPLGQEDGFNLVFNDEFDTQTLNRLKWTRCYWWDKQGCTNLSNNNLQWYMRDNVTVEDGKLVLTARPETVVGWEGRKFPYTSGMVTSGRYYAEHPSASRFDATYGFFEMRAKIPAGQGLWPAFWLLPSKHESLPEIDIMEVLGHDPSLLELHFHYRNSAGEKRSAGYAVRTTNLSQGWHTYGVDWSPEHIIWYLDGQEVWRFSDRSRIPNEPMYMIVNLAVGGDWPGNPDETTRFPARMEVDYIRAWSHE
ncbi:glycoside hydrolase family 16 protein [Tabrizicola sp. M-4]|uniref:glycoside hydrolase family 16 protein n=1 Tax=Tabrizicola sp. M-4 TaxID=3055847 RepID=UPI003DAA4DA9